MHIDIIHIYMYVYVCSSKDWTSQRAVSGSRDESLRSCLSRSLSLSLYIYIYTERERESDVYIFMYIYREREK